MVESGMVFCAIERVIFHKFLLICLSLIYPGHVSLFEHFEIFLILVKIVLSNQFNLLNEYLFVIFFFLFVEYLSDCSKDNSPTKTGHCLRQKPFCSTFF